MILYEEKQYFRNKLVLFMLSALLVGVLTGVYQQVVNGIPFGAQPLSDTALVVVSIIPFVLFMMMVIINMKIRIDETGLFFRIIPFQRKYHVYYWKEVEAVQVKKSQEQEDETWQSESGKIFNKSGENGLQLILKNGGKVMFGTVNPAELKSVLYKLQEKGIVRTEEQTEEF